MLRRIGAMVMGLALAASLAAAPVSAATGDYAGDNVFTVNNAVAKAEYKLYRLLKLETRTEAKDGKTVVVSYRYSYDASLEGVIGTVIKMDAFKYVPLTGEDDTDPRHGYGFKVDSDDGVNNVTFVTPADDGRVDNTVRSMMTAFADELRRQAIDTDKLTVADTRTAPDTGENLTVSFEDISDGYWMVTSNAGARSVLFTTPGADGAQEVAMTEKNSAPKVSKQVFDEDDADGSVTANGGSWQGSADAQIGETVKFRISAELYNGAENIRIHDEMSDGLTFGEIEGVKFFPRVNGTTYDREVYELGSGGKTTVTVLELTDEKGSIYDLTEDDHGFVLTLKNSFTNPAAGDRDASDPKNNVFLGNLSTLEDDGGRLEIEYTATLNEDAEVGTAGNTNESYVEYGHIPGVDPGRDPGPGKEPPHRTSEEEAKVYTYEFRIDKFIDGSESAKLKDAEFEIRQRFVNVGKTESETVENAWIDGGSLKLPADLYDISSTAPLALVDETPDTEGYAGGKVFRVAKPGETGTVTKIVTDDSGLITVRGLDSNLYSVTETAAPEGYIKMDDPAMIVIGSAFSGKTGVVFRENVDAERGDEDPYVFNELGGTKVDIPNASGIRLPDAGGIGTTIFYAAGAVLVLGAGALMVVKKKKAGRSED